MHYRGRHHGRGGAGGAGGEGAAVLVVVANAAAVVVESSARGELSCLGGSRGTFPLLGSEYGVEFVRLESGYKIIRKMSPLPLSAYLSFV